MTSRYLRVKPESHEGACSDLTFLLIFSLPSASLEHTPRVLAVNPAQPACASPAALGLPGLGQLSGPRADLAALRASAGPSPGAGLRMEGPGPCTPSCSHHPACAEYQVWGARRTRGTSLLDVRMRGRTQDRGMWVRGVWVAASAGLPECARGNRGGQTGGLSRV